MKLNGALKGLIIDKTLRVRYPLVSLGQMVDHMTVDVTQTCSLLSNFLNLIITPL